MDETKTDSSIDALIALLKATVNREGGPVYTHLVLYTSFGVVRGRASFSFIQSYVDSSSDALSEFGAQPEVIELSEASVEHYSNHLPTGTFERLYVRLSDVRGFALLQLQAQG